METTLIILFCFGLLITFARLIGWALGISEVRKTNEHLIHLTEQMLNGTQQLIHIQQTIAESNGIRIPSKSDQAVR
jgi:hypothetical protein